MNVHKEKKVPGTEPWETPCLCPLLLPQGHQPYWIKAHLMTAFQPNCLVKRLHLQIQSRSEVLGVRALTYKSAGGGGTVSPVTVINRLLLRFFLMQSFQTENFIIFKKTVNLNTSFPLKILKRFYLSMLYEYKLCPTVTCFITMISYCKWEISPSSTPFYPVYHTSALISLSALSWKGWWAPCRDKNRSNETTEN